MFQIALKQRDHTAQFHLSVMGKHPLSLRVFYEFFLQLWNCYIQSLDMGLVDIP